MNAGGSGRTPRPAGAFVATGDLNLPRAYRLRVLHPAAQADRDALGYKDGIGAWACQRNGSGLRHWIGHSHGNGPGWSRFDRRGMHLRLGRPTRLGSYLYDWVLRLPAPLLYAACQHRQRQSAHRHP